MARSALLLLLLTSFGAAQTTDVAAYRWSATGPLQVARYGACAAALPDGRILVAGGMGLTGPLRSVEIYQQDGSFVPAADMIGSRFGHACTALADGRVLVSGGPGEGGSPAAEVFDSAANQWTAVEFGASRWNHSATPLPDGRVLLAGGQTGDGATGLLEWYNPAANRIRPLPNTLAAARLLHAAAVLPDGSVLITGGWNGQALLDAAEIVGLDGGVRTAGSLPAARAGHTATALPNGCVLIAGGLGTDGNLKSASLYCADSGTFQPAGEMAVARFLQLALLLPNNGMVLVTGGFSGGEPTDASELYDFTTNTFVPAGALTRARLGIAGAADPISGAVLAVGGYTDEGPLAACGILRVPSAAFDKARYVDGDAITVTGLGWTPGEKVNLQVSTTTFAPPGQLAQISLQNFQTVASALGRIQQTLFTALAARAGATYRVNASGVTSGLTAASSAVQVSRTTVTLNITPGVALTRQLVVLQAVVQPQTAIGQLDGQVAFQVAGNPVGTVSSTGQVISFGLTAITDGTSNTIQFGEPGPLPPNATGFSRTFTASDGSVRTIAGGGAFQFATQDLPAGSNVLTATPSATAAYSPFTSLYAPNSGAGTLSIQKRTVNLSVTASSQAATPKVGDPIALFVNVGGTQLPAADVAPTGVAHVTLAPGIVADAPLSPSVFNQAARGSATVMLPAGPHTFAAQYDGDAVYLPGSVPSSGSITVAKGSVGFSLIPGKQTYTVGEQITITGRITHPKVSGATPTGSIVRSLGPAQFQGAGLAGDPGNAGVIDTNLPVTGFPTAGNFTVVMSYSGDANFNAATAGAILTVTKATPQISLIAPVQIVAGQEAVFTVRAVGAANLPFHPPITGQVTLTGVANGATASLVAGPTSSTGTLRQTFPSAGTFSIAVQYAGDTNYLPVASATVSVTVQ
jgi:hypothetical protein